MSLHEILGDAEAASQGNKRWRKMALPRDQTVIDHEGERQMLNCGTQSAFDHRFEDPSKLRGQTRRGFLANLIRGTATSAGLLSIGSKGYAAATSDLISIPIGATPDDEEYWLRVKDQFLVRDGLSYMNSGTKGPSPRNVYQAQRDALENTSADVQQMGSHYFLSDYSKTLRHETKHKMAQFLGANPSEIAFTNNTTEGMIFGTMGVDLERGDQIIYTNHDHPFGCNPILYRAAKDGFDVGIIDLSDPRFHPPKDPNTLLEVFENAITSKTKLLSFCHINYTDGCIMPVKEICELARSKGVITLVDGAQAPGMLKVDLHDLACDMYAGACHKWVLAGMYTGFFYVREDFQERVKPILYTGPTNGQTMHGPESDAARASRLRDYPGASVFELRGSGDFPSRISINAALDFQNHITPQSVEARIRYMATRLIQGLRNIDGVKVYVSDDPRLSCGLVSFTIKSLPTARVNADLWFSHDIWIRSVAHREIDWDANRASVHLMVTIADVDRLINAVEGLAART
jgi:isopenicillin-N epimerase